METVYDYCMFGKHLQAGDTPLSLLQIFVWVQRESPHSMSLQIMAFLRGELLHFSPPSLLFFLLFLPFCSPTPPLLPRPFPPSFFPLTTLSLTLSIFPPPCYPLMYFLCVWPEGTGRRVICLKDRRTALTQCCKLWHQPWLRSWKRAFHHVMLVRLISTQQLSYLCINIKPKDDQTVCCQKKYILFQKQDICIKDLYIIYGCMRVSESIQARQAENGGPTLLTQHCIHSTWPGKC